MCVCVCVCVCVSVCECVSLCVFEKARERECVFERERICVCVRVYSNITRLHLLYSSLKQYTVMRISKYSNLREMKKTNGVNISHHAHIKYLQSLSIRDSQPTKLPSGYA